MTALECVTSAAGLFVSLDERVAEAHDLMNTCVRFIKQNEIPSELAEELKHFYSMDVLQLGAISLKDQNLVYRSLPLSLQVQVQLAV